jgi:hypothetical protein
VVTMEAVEAAAVVTMEAVEAAAVEVGQPF